MKILIVLTLIFSTNLYAEDFYLAAGAGVQEDSITEQDLRRVFLGRKTSWDDGSAIRTCMLDDQVMKEEFFNQIDSNADAFERNWARMVFSGRAIPPATQRDEASLTEFLRKNPKGLCITTVKPANNELQLVDG